MKNLIIIGSLILSNVLLADELSWVDEQVQAIKPPRIGMKKRDLTQLKDPFIFLKKNRGEEEEEEKKVEQAKSFKPNINTKKIVKVALPQSSAVTKKILSLDAILNKSVLINSRWYTLNDKVNGYTIREIHSHSVLLVKNQKQLLLSTKSSNSKIKFQK